VGGHCIPIDPFYLTWKAREYEMHTKLIETASQINDYMPEYVVERITEALNERGMAVKGAHILLLGVAYKRDIDDWRESPALRIMHTLEKKGALVEYHDEHVPTLQWDLGTKCSISDPEWQAYDLVMIHTDHSSLDYGLVAQQSRLVFDVRNAVKNTHANVVRL